MSTTTTTPVLQARGLSRQFGSVRALNNVDFEVYPGEVTALIGDNGAGKSTLVKALSGNLAVDEGDYGALPKAMLDRVVDTVPTKLTDEF